MSLPPRTCPPEHAHPDMPSRACPEAQGRPAPRPRRGALAPALAALCLLLLAPALARAGEDLRLWHAYRDAEAAALVEIVEAFSARTGHRVELLAVAHESFASKLTATIPRGQGPDVFID